MPDPAPLSRLLLPCLILAAAGCIEDRLTVDIRTQVHADGTCTRRIDYRLERFDSEKGETPVEIPTDQDALRLFHRFPAGEPWVVSNEATGRLHTVSAEAALPSPNAIEWDYWRVLTPQSPPARNHVSFAMAGASDEAVFEYAETFLNPVSPVAAARSFALVLSQHEDEFARELQTAFGKRILPPVGVKRAYRNEFVLPFTKRITALAARPMFGPRERKELEALFEDDDGYQKALVLGLIALAPGADPADMERAVNDAFDSQWPSIEKELVAAGVPISALLPGLAEPRARIRFRVTLVLPAAIVRANTCFQGDTATWEFDESDLYGRGFEMWAKAVAR